MNWFHKFFNPHCPDCKLEREDSKICASCETLKLEIERLRLENDKLLNKILEKHTKEKISGQLDEPRLPISSGNMPWNVRRQMLEKEDRERAKLIREAPKPRTDVKSVEDLEKELGVDNASI